jgi:tRNA dimethylallyltransferase
MDRKNKHRLIRAIELAQEGLKPTKVKPDFEVLQVGIDIPRKKLHERIDRRVDERFEQGMLEEVVGLIKSGVNPEWLIGLGLEYREITNFIIQKSKFRYQNYSGLSEAGPHPHSLPLTKGELEGVEFQEMSQKLKWRIHQFARRQMTWFRRFPEIEWLSDYNEIKRFVKIFLKH